MRMEKKTRHRTQIWVLAAATFLMGCAATTQVDLPPSIPEGKGQLLLEAGGIMELNWSVIDQETQEVVLSLIHI